MTSSNDNVSLVASAVAGDQSSLERLLWMNYCVLETHIRPKIPRDFQNVLGVEDVLQMTFSHAFRDIDKFEPHSYESFVAWLKAIADNRLKDALKRLRRKKRGGHLRRAQPTADEQSDSIADLAEKLTGGVKSPSHSVARHEAVRAIHIVLAELPCDYQQAIRLRYLEGFSLDETAQAMNRTPGAIRGLLDRAKKQMREGLGRASMYLSAS